jgi:hypothetical protein
MQELPTKKTSIFFVAVLDIAFDVALLVRGGGDPGESLELLWGVEARSIPKRRAVRVWQLMGLPPLLDASARRDCGSRAW